MMNESSKEAAIHILGTMWDISSIEMKRYEPGTNMHQWLEGRLSGLHHALFCMALTGAIKTEVK